MACMPWPPQSEGMRGQHEAASGRLSVSGGVFLLAEAEPRLPPHSATLLFLEVARLLSCFPQRVTFRNRGRRAQRSPAQTPAQTAAAPRAACVPAGAAGAAGAAPAALTGTGSRPRALLAACCPVSPRPSQGPTRPEQGLPRRRKLCVQCLLCFAFILMLIIYFTYFGCAVFLAAQAYLQLQQVGSTP